MDLGACTEATLRESGRTRWFAPTAPSDEVCERPALSEVET
jgi:hypothetical protein